MNKGEFFLSFSLCYTCSFVYYLIIFHKCHFDIALNDKLINQYFFISSSKKFDAKIESLWFVLEKFNKNKEINK